MPREWDIPKRDLLDIERTAQAQSVEAADHLADVAEAVCRWVECGCDPSTKSLSLLTQALRAYRIARGQDTGDENPSNAV